MRITRLKIADFKMTYIGGYNKLISIDSSNLARNDFLGFRNMGLVDFGSSTILPIDQFYCASKKLLLVTASRPSMK